MKSYCRHDLYRSGLIIAVTALFCTVFGHAVLFSFANQLANPVKPDSTVAPPKHPAGTQADSGLSAIRDWNRTGRVEEAERAARALLEKAEREHGSESIEVGEILDELATSIRRSGRSQSAEALEICERALRIKEGACGKDDPRYAASLYNLGMLHYMRQDYQHGFEIMQETLAIQSRALGSNDPAVAKTYIAMGAIQHDLGNLERALPFTERGVAMEEIVLGSDNPDRVLGLNSLGVLRYSLGDFGGAVPILEEAIRLGEQSPTPNQPLLATCYHNLAAVYADMGNNARAIELLKKALGLREQEFGNTGQYVCNTLTVLGEAYLQAGDLRRAKEALLRAVRIGEETDPGGPTLGWALMKLGWFYLAQGDVPHASESLERSLRYQENSLGADHPKLWITLRGLARVAAMRGHDDAARAYYDRAVEILQDSSGPRHPDMGATLVEYASFLLDAGDSLGAFELAVRATVINRDHLKRTFTALTEHQALEYGSKLETGLDVGCAALSGTLRAGSSDMVRRLWDALVRSRALVLDEIGARARWITEAGTAVESARRLEEARNRLANLLVRGSSGDLGTQEQRLVDRARDEVERAERDLAAQSRSFRIENDRAEAGLERVLWAVPSRSALVSYFIYGPAERRSYIAFVAGPDRTLHAVPLGFAEEIERLVADWRTLAGRPPPGDDVEQRRVERACRLAGEHLRSHIWEPIRPLLADARLALLVPDGPIHLVNLAALPAPDSGYLAEAPPMIHYISTERDIVWGARVHDHGAGLLAVGDPAFDRPEQRSPSAPWMAAIEPGGADGHGGVPAYREALNHCGEFRSVRFKPLPQSKQEIHDLERVWNRTANPVAGRAEALVLEGDRAGERSVKEFLPGRRIAHFATHGFFLDGTCKRSSDAGPLGRGIGGISIEGAKPVAPKAQPARDAPVNPFQLSGIALAGANLRADVKPGEEDGILVAEEIASLDLSSLDWAVLSACDTGVGEVRSGEGVLGLRRALQIAGAGTLIMSLWTVEDQAARTWMTELYDARLSRLLGTCESVREANLSVLRSLRAQGRSTHPFYWAAFIAVGDWR